MSQQDVDVIIVGAGIAGACSAVLCARAGLSVLLLERATTPGAKNLSGGRIYGYAFEDIFPDFAHQAPLEREVVRESFSQLTSEGATTLSWHNSEPAQRRSWSVLRARFDPWLFAQAEAEGVTCLTGTTVDSLIVEGQKVCGVRCGEEAIHARLVILCEGANTLLAEQHGLVIPLSQDSLAIGVKEVLALPANTLEDRFNLEPGQGAAWLFSGGICEDLPAGGFIYTNRDTLSVGLVCPLSSVSRASKPLATMLADFKQHPTLRPLLRSAETLEYAAHMVPEGGLHTVPDKLAGPGWILAGDSARFCVNTGFTIRGMDMAALSARAAAQTALLACRGNPEVLDMNEVYRNYLAESTLRNTLARYRHVPGLLQGSRGWFKDYPAMSHAILKEVYQAGHYPPAPLASLLWKHGRKRGLTRLALDTIRSIRCL